MVKSSSLAPSDVEVHEGLIFSKVDGIKLAADIYLPLGLTSLRPAIIWIHGGGWRVGDRKLGPDLRRHFAKAGFVMVSIDYRLSGEATFPAQAVDVACAVRWIRSVADRYGIDANRIALWGSSAGAHLGSLVAMAPEDTFSSTEHLGCSSAVQAVVDGYGPTDFLQADDHRDPAGKPSDDLESMQLPPNKRSTDPDSFESQFLGVPLLERPDLVARANPITYARSGLPPFLIMHGLTDTAVPHHQSEILYEALALHQNDVTLVLIEGLGHGFFNRRHFGEKIHATTVRSTRNPEEFADRPPTFDLVLDFLRSRLAGD